MSHLILIGGGEMKARETLPIDEFIAAAAKKIAGERRAVGLFLPTASHDCMPYYNTFHKVYTGLFGIKTDVALTVGRTVDPARLKEKFDRADFLYIGGGNTVFMLHSWRESGLLSLVKEAFDGGKLICGLSAGAICWFEEMYTDSAVEGEYRMYPGLGWVGGKISPHYDERSLDFDEILLYNKSCAWGLENNAALEMKDGEPVGSICCGGAVWRLDGSSGERVVKTKFK